MTLPHRHGWRHSPCNTDTSRHLRILSATHRPSRQAQPRRIALGVTAANQSGSTSLTDLDLLHLRKAAVTATASKGLYQPHPYSGCVMVNSDGRIIAETHQKAQVSFDQSTTSYILKSCLKGMIPAECQAAELVDATGCTAYLNMECSSCDDGIESVKALVNAGVQRVVMGMLNPLPHLRGRAFKALLDRGIQVSVLGMDACCASEVEADETLLKCLSVNEALLHRAATQRPLSVLKYAMTMDGKIAAYTGHAAWVSSSLSRQRVFAMRAISDAVIVGGNTVRRDNPSLTTRRETGFFPVRIVMSRTLDLPSDANLWDVTSAPTVVMTQRGARIAFQQELRDKGIEVVEFDFLSPNHVADYCYERGFLQLLWECGGALSAPAISDGVIHKVMAFVSPKIIGGVKAPSPCGDLGFVEMTQAVKITDLTIEQVGPDVLMTGYLPSSGGLQSVHETVSNLQAKQPNITTYKPTILQNNHSNGSGPIQTAVKFYKAWDEWGALSNFAIYPIKMLNGVGPHGKLATETDADVTIWKSVEHYYQAQKFAGVDDPSAQRIREEIMESECAEAAAKIGRRYERVNSALLRTDWYERRVEIMHEALLAKYQTHEGPRKLLLSTGTSLIVENSPHDSFWGCGVDGLGENHLGKLLMLVRGSSSGELESRSQLKAFQA